MTSSADIPETDFQDRIQIWLEHIHALAEDIGPRGPTTEGERRGHQYCQEKLEFSGLQASWETFRAARSNFTPHLVTALAMLAAFILYPLAGQTSAILAAVISAAALVSELLELSQTNNPLRLIVPKGDSQNVFAVQEPEGEHKQDLLLIGHVDSQRTPIIFKNNRWLAAYQNFTTLAFVGFFSLVILYVVGIFTQSPWIWPVSAFGALCAVILAAMMIQADLTPYTAGANDNATAAGLVLTLADHLQTDQLKHTRVWFVLTGCEESQHYGAIDFLERHLGDFKNPYAIVFEMLGCAGPSWLVKEGIVIPFKAAEEMVQVAEYVNSVHPELDGYPVKISGGNTEMTDALRRGIPAITLFGMTRENIPPYWHQVEDTVDKIDNEYLAKNYAFALYYIKLLDEMASGL